MRNQLHLHLKSLGILAAAVSSLSVIPSAQALELNWSGQFRAEYHLVHNYSLDSGDSGAIFDPNRLQGPLGTAPAGYYIPGGGTRAASFQTLFLKLRPKLVVNDNIYIKSEWWVGDPVFGIFGNSVPYSGDQRQYYSNQSRGATISAQRVWLELLTDFGTVQIGRVPLDYGLGLVWSAGEGMWDRYESTGDAFRLLAKFGNFSFAPSYIVYSAGNSVGGTCVFGATGCVPNGGESGVVDYSFMLKYENLEDDFEAGLNLIRRLGGLNRDPSSGFLTSPGVAGQLNYNTWDIFARKRLGTFTLSGEMPIASGQLGGLPYSTVALATEVSWKPSDNFETSLKVGHAPGQPGDPSGTLQSYQGFYFNPNYHLGMIMFNYQLANFSGYSGGNTMNSTAATPGNQLSPWDNPVTNANYLSLGANYKTQKWTFNAGGVYAMALQTAHQGEFYYNSWRRGVEGKAAVREQGTGLGTEFDLGASFQWDDYFVFRWDLGVFLPGDYFSFSNTAIDNATNPVFASAIRVGVTF